MRFRWSILFTWFGLCISNPSTTCPSWMSENGTINDLGLLADTVSWNGGYQEISGACGRYSLIAESDGIYDTRMRIYEDGSDIYINYRPTQQTPAGGDIHVNRVMTPCTFIDGCTGLVHQRFQEAFLDLLHRLPENLIEDRVKGRRVHLCSHSLGGSLQLFMGVYLWKQHDTVPATMLGLAGPFIGDRAFTDAYQRELKTLTGDRWWQVETVSAYNSYSYDGTVEGYNVDNWPYIDIMYESICGVVITPLPDSYGMHDLRNYRLAMTGTNC